MFVIHNQFLAVNEIDFNEVDLYKIGKHTYVLKAPNLTERQGIVFKFQRGRIPAPGDVIHVTQLADDESRVDFDRQIIVIQRKHDDYVLKDSSNHLRLDMDDNGYVVGFAIRHEGDNEKTILNQHSLEW